ncbi:MAG TPA: hypothetical protein VFM32_01055, partial [Spongiibacteraceae bacterium]|nr:hypothetical protein [Spongiibacteraceae bacterium]
VFADPDRFNMHRDRTAPHMSFGSGIHTCIGNVLGRLEGRVVFEELLKRIPEWDIDLENANLMSTSTVRGWDTLPAYVNSNGAAKIKSRIAAAAAAENAQSTGAPKSVDGAWTVIVKSPMGPMETKLVLKTVDGKLTGEQSGEGSTTPIEQASYDSNTGNISWSNKVTKPMKITSTFSGKVESNQISGKVKAGFMGSFSFTGAKS